MMQRLEFRAMGCQMAAIVDADDARAVAALAQIPGWFEEWEQHLSRFRPDSELNQLNRRAEDAFHVSDVLWQVLQQSLVAAKQSDGLVTPAVLDALDAAGYDKSFESAEMGVEALAGYTLVNSMKPAKASTPMHDLREIELDHSARTVRLPRGMRLDFGGVAKGWAADQAAARLAAYAPALLDAGGDIAISGPMVNGDPWPVAVADPMEPERDLTLLMLRNESVATSGRDYRRWARNGEMQHHIIDPRTGRPAETDVLSATVVAQTASEAEVATKVALILGSGSGLKWIEAREQFAAMLVLDDGRILRSSQTVDYEG